MYLSSPSSNFTGTNVEFLDHSGTNCLNASISSCVTLYIAFAPSTTISGKFCAGKLYELNVASYYEQQDETNFWAGRRQIYEYLQQNKAVMDKLSLSKKEGDANVGFQFNIDRSALGGSVKGVEIVNVMIDASGRGGLNQLQMKYRFTNKWFCPE